MPVVISSSQQTTRLPIEFHIEPIEHLDRCCAAADQSACLDLPSGGQEASQLELDMCGGPKLDRSHLPSQTVAAAG